MTVVYNPVTYSTANFTVNLNKAPGVDDVVVTLRIYSGLPAGTSIGGATAATPATGSNGGSYWNFSTDGNYLGFDGSNSMTKTITFRDRETSKTVSIPIPPKITSSSMFDNTKCFYVAIESVNENASPGDRTKAYAVINYTAPLPRIEYVTPDLGNPASSPINPAPSGGGGGDGDGCFTLDSKITMFDGSFKLLKDVVVGDKVQSGKGWGFNTVIDIEHEECLPGRKLYSINDSEAFITDNHPVYKNGQLVSMIPEFSSFAYPWLGKIKQAQTTSVKVIQEPTMVANLVLDGDFTYIVNNVPVHNILEHGYLPTLMLSSGTVDFATYQKICAIHVDTQNTEYTRMGYYWTMMPLVKFCYRNKIFAKPVSIIAKHLFLNQTTQNAIRKIWTALGKVFYKKPEINSGISLSVELV
jgi:hypothetical protein